MWPTKGIPAPALRFWGFLALVFVGGLAVVKLMPDSVYSEVGKALIIAAVLAAGVDSYVKSKLVADVAKDISPYAVGYLLPNEVKEEIRNLLRVPLVRNNMEILYRLSRIPGNPGYLRSRVQLTYRVMNLTDVPQEYEHSVFCEKSFFPDVGAAMIEGIGLTGGDHAYSICPGQSDFQVEDRGGSIQIRRKILIPKKGHEELLFWSQYSEIFREIYSDTVLMVWPTIGITLHVECPPELTVEAFIFKRTEAKAVPTDNPRRWSHDGVFLSGEHIRIRWRPKENSGRG
jgi:hypothetical protein